MRRRTCRVKLGAVFYGPVTPEPVSHVTPAKGAQSGVDVAAIGARPVSHVTPARSAVVVVVSLGRGRCHMCRRLGSRDHGAVHAGRRRYAENFSTDAGARDQHDEFQVEHADPQLVRNGVNLGTTAIGPP